MLAIHDPYPTRRDEPQILPRNEPVVWGKAKRSSWLTTKDIEKFERDGFLFIPGFFSNADVERFLEESLRLSRYCAEHNPEESFMERGSNILRSLFCVHKFSDMYREVARDAALLDVIRELLDDDVYLHQTRLNYKPPFRGKEFYWHSDFETWHAEDGMPKMRAVSASIILTENNPYNGPLMLIPGSHKHFITCVGETPEGHYRQSLVRQELGTPDNESLECMVARGGLEMPMGPPGSLLLFDCNTLHGSNSNVSPYARSNLFFVYNAVSNAVVEPYAAPQPRPEFVATRANIVPL